MQIVHVTECLAGGVLSFLKNLTSELNNEKHIIIYGKRAGTPTDVEKQFGNNVKFIYWKHAQRELRPKKDLYAFIELIRYLHNIPQIDVLHLHSSKAGALGRAAARILGLQKRTIYSPHGVSFARKDITERKRMFYVAFERIGKVFGGQVVACSLSERQLLINNGIKPVKVINNGISVAKKMQIRGVPNYPLCVGTVGRITAAKNPALFNRIARYFINDERVNFLWIGDGELKSELTCGDNLTVTGWISGSELDKSIEKIDIYLSTSLWEGLPLSVLEAMNDYKPLVLSNCIGNIDLVQSGENGFSFKSYGDAVDYINYLLDNPQALEKMGKKSYEILFNDFSLKSMGEKYLQLYYSLSN